MKKSALMLFLITITASSIAGDELAAMWTRLYNRLDTLEYKLSIMQNIAEQESRELVPLISEALAETNSNRRSITDSNQKRIYHMLQKIIIKELGDYKALETEEQVYEALKNTDSLQVKTEALTSLGRIGSVKYLEELTLMLRNINMRTSAGSDRREDETIAFALIITFENLRRIETFEQAFHASSGWYSPRSGVRDRAKKALKIITDDPTDVLLDILRKESDLNKKYLALLAQNDSAAPDEKKSSLAVRGLHEGITNKASDISDKTRLSAIRLLSCKILTDSSVKAPEAVTYLEEMLFSNYDLNEKLTAIETLGTYKSIEAVKSLSSFLRQQNDRQSSGMVKLAETRAVVTAINSLAKTENPAAVEEIMIVNTIDWPAEVLRAAEAALKKLKQ
jgi:HEAT repeat protein